MSIFKAEIEGYECTISFGFDGKPRYRCSEIEGKDYPEFSALEKAVKDYNLKLRKNFKNDTAYRVWRAGWGDVRGEKINTVKVTSVESNGKQAWIRNHKGDREKVERIGLYADKAELEEALKREAFHNKSIKDVWAGVKRWEPKP